MSLDNQEKQQETPAVSTRKKFSPGLSHLHPVLFAFALTGLLGYPLSVSGFNSPKVTLFPETPEGAGLNAGFLVLSLTVSATLMLLLVRKRKTRFLRGMVKAGLILMSFVVTVWYGASLAVSFAIPVTDVQLLTVSVALALTIAIFVYGRERTLQAFGITIVGASTGLFLGASIPILTSLAIVCALAIYDTVSVFKGPIGELAKSIEMSDLTGAVFTYRELTIGMGDIVFYSLIEAVALLNYGIPAFIATGLGVTVGAYLGFRALTRFQVFPGLPFSLLLGAAGMLIVAFLQGLLF